MYSLQTLLLIALLTAPLVKTQAPPVVEQSTGFNSTFTLSPSQIESANLSSETVANLNTVINFDRSQLANGGPAGDSFYELPPLTNTSSGALQPGTLLKIQEVTNTTPFVVPPNTALSRILYTTTNHNGTVIPASAFVLWPFGPKTFQQGPLKGNGNAPGSKAPVVLWTHGTSGFFASQAPSTHRALWYADAAPFTLALAGYAVVGPDYAGLGISKSWDGSDIPHQYLLSSASARDALYAMQASLDAFEVLDEHFVVMGHSQGGGVAWGVAEVLAAEGATKFPGLVKGYLGTIAASPTTDLFSGVPEFIVSWVGMVLDSIFPDFDLGLWLTPLGIARTKLLKEIEGGIAASQQLFLSGGKIVRDDYYNATWYADAYANIANAGGKPFKGPLLVLQGTRDVYVPQDSTTAAVGATCEANPGGDLEYFVVNGTGHVPTLNAARQVWLQWIEDRFEGRVLEKSGCARTGFESFLPWGRYLSVGNSFPQFAGLPEYSYQVPLGL
ncbi:putative secretory lipase [Hypomontagnella submonticulosa]|nr:putative secretory lipase [Hypomontagnella submonticulosa]